MEIKRYFVILGCALLSACANHAAPDLTPAQPASSRSPDAASVAVSYLLVDPVTEMPASKTPYFLFLKQRTIASAAREINVISDRVAHGITDDKGRTGTIYLDGPGDGAYDLVARHGNGRYGTYFRLSSTLSKNMPIRDWYEIRGCNPEKVYRGFSDRNGLTFYVTSDTPCKSTLRVGHQYKPSSSK